MSLLELSKEALVEQLVHDASAIALSSELAALLVKYAPTNPSDVDLMERLLATLHTYISELSDPKNTLIVLCRYIASNPLVIADAATKLGFEICQVHVSFIPSVVDAWKAHVLTAADAEIGCRFAALLVRLLRIDNNFFSVCESAGACQLVTALTQTDDMLLQMVSLVFLAGFSETSSGIEYIFRHNSIAYLISLSCGHNTGEESSIRSTALQLLVDIIKQGHQLNNGTTFAALWTDEHEDKLLQALVINLEGNDYSCKVAAVNALAMYMSLSDSNLTKLLSGRRDLLRMWLSLLNSKVSPSHW
jgi:AcrR family transcriptional regulator